VFTKVLIANRGEVSVRVTRTLRRLGIASVAVYSDADAGAPHVRAADEAVRIGPPPAAHSYLSVEAIIAAARAAGAQAIHPGYGFLAENARFARACAAAGLTFIGPSPEAIEAMGDKIAAKATVAAAGVPVVPGAGAARMTDQQLISAVNGAWFPVLVKPSAGGGGKGMRVARAPAQLPEALAAARREARAAFGDDTLLVEKYIDRPRHIEVQVLADSHGKVFDLGERECSLQRRHQKVIEEAPSPLLDTGQRLAMTAAAAEVARRVGYTGAGTVEFIVDGASPGSFYFMEMNTRLQVEHPVTELITGVDLVEWQIRVAAGEELPFGLTGAGTVRLPTGRKLPYSRHIRWNGHAIEARVYAEDPARGFLPTGGTVLAYREPDGMTVTGDGPPARGSRPIEDVSPAIGMTAVGTGVRVDSGIAAGSVVTSAYDPMLAKVAAWGPDRATALRRLDAALREMTILGVTTNVAFLRALLADPDVQAGHLDTTLIERKFTEPLGPGPTATVPPHVLHAAALLLLDPGPGGAVTDPWEIADGWRVGEHAWTRLRLAAGTGEVADVRVRGLASAGLQVAIGDGEPVTVSGATDGDRLIVAHEDRVLTYLYALDGRTAWLGRDGLAWAITRERADSRRGGAAGAADHCAGTVRSPMPGTVLSVAVAAGDTVTAGQPLAVVEAMKMEHTVTAPLAGIVAELLVKAGKQVQMDETLAVIEEASDA
jgi:acetyl-CoA/propionyl-CoA carboxylase biotin carboxyl carrier protein